MTGSSSEALLRFGLAVLATWRVTHLLAYEDGPADIVARVRGRLGDSPIGGLMDCFNCLSLWIAAPAALFLSARPVVWVVGWLAISGAACLLERWGEKPLVIEPGAQQSEGGEDHVLRSNQSGDA